MYVIFLATISIVEKHGRDGTEVMWLLVKERTVVGRRRRRHAVGIERSIMKRNTKI